MSRSFKFVKKLAESTKNFSSLQIHIQSTKFPKIFHSSENFNVAQHKNHVHLRLSPLLHRELTFHKLSKASTRHRDQNLFFVGGWKWTSTKERRTFLCCCCLARLRLFNEHNKYLQESFSRWYVNGSFLSFHERARFEGMFLCLWSRDVPRLCTERFHLRADCCCPKGKLLMIVKFIARSKEREGKCFYLAETSENPFLFINKQRPIQEIMVIQFTC